MMNIITLLFPLLSLCLNSCKTSSFNHAEIGDQITIECTNSDRGSIIQFSLKNKVIYKEEVFDSRGCIIDSVMAFSVTHYFVCHEYDSYCSLFRYYYSNGAVLKEQIIDITESLLQVEDPSIFPVNYRDEKLFELELLESEKSIIVKTNVFPNYSIPEISREVVISIDNE